MAPAQEVFIFQQLDSDLDFRTFRLGSFGFGDVFVTVPTNRAFYSTRLDLRTTKGIYVDVVASIDVTTGEAFWRLTSIDPATGEIPTDVTRGFLPPNTNAPAGEGFVSYSIRPRADVSTGTRIDALATIVFDIQPPIDTPPIFNTLEAGAPASVVHPLPTNSYNPTFTVSWSGTDDEGGSGITDYDIFVSDNGSAFTAWLSQTTLSEAPYVGQAGHTYAFYSVARDNAGNVEAVPSTPDAITSVASNRPPVITPVPPKSVDEETELTITISANDPDSVSARLTFALAPGAPANAVINATNGLFAWTPTEAQGPATNTIRILVTDDGTPSLTATQNMTVVVNEVNIAPLLPPISNQTAYVLSPFRVTNVVIDPDIPTNRMTFQLAPGAPMGSRINTNSGVFSWTPSRAQAPSSNHVTVTVSDKGSPPLSATNSFVVVVGDFLEVSLGSTVVRAGQTSGVSITMNSSAGVTNLSFFLDAPEGRLTNFALPFFLPDVAGALLPAAPNLSFISLSAAAGTPLMGNRELSTLAFTATTNEPSGIIPLSVVDLIATKGNGVPVPRTIANNGRVVIVGSAPLLEPLIQTNGLRTLLLYGIPQTGYRLESTTNFTSGVTWKLEWQGTLTNVFQNFDVSTIKQTIFYRAVSTP